MPTPQTNMSLTFTVNGTQKNVQLNSDNTISLATPASGANQQWILAQDSGSGIWYIQSSTGWLAIDFSKSPLAVGVPWLDASSPNSVAIIDTPDGGPEYIAAWNQAANAMEIMAPGSDGVSLEMQPFPTGWTWTTPMAPSGPPPSGYVPSGYVKVFEDLFTGTSLDTTKWWTRYAGSDGLQQNIPSNGEIEIFEEGQDGEPNHVMTGNSVKLTAYGPRASDGLYPSGMLRCKQTLNLGSQTTAFYVEIVAKMPNAQGSWPALWFSAEPKVANVSPPWPPEMDFAEFMNNAANTDNSTMVGVNVQLNGQVPGPWNNANWTYGSPVPSGWTWSSVGRTKWITPIDFSADFHTFGFWCLPGVAGTNTVNPVTGQLTHQLHYFVDAYNSFSAQYDPDVGADGTTGWNAELLIDLAVGGVGGGTPDPTHFPCALEIQRVSIFLSQEDSSALVPSTIGQDLMPPTGG